MQSSGTNGMAVASFVCAFLCSLLAVIFGHIALSQIGKSRQGGRGLAIAGLVLGYIGIVVGLLVALLLIGGAASEIDSQSDSRGNDSACAADLKTLEVAVEAYFAFESTYPTSVEQLITDDPSSDPPSYRLLNSRPTGADLTGTNGNVIAVGECSGG